VGDRPQQPRAGTLLLVARRALQQRRSGLLASPNRVVPIEVKAGKSGTMKSLYQFAKQSGAELAVRFDTNPPSKSPLTHRMPDAGTVHLDLLSLPLYFAGQTRRLLASA
jgi:hypothetical protein